MSLSDSAEYWLWRTEKKTPKEKRHIPTHDCKPRGGPPGTRNRWKCQVCGKRFASIAGKED